MPPKLAGPPAPGAKYNPRWAEGIWLPDFPDDTLPDEFPLVRNPRVQLAGAKRGYESDADEDVGDTNVWNTCKVAKRKRTTTTATTAPDGEEDNRHIICTGPRNTRPNMCSDDELILSMKEQGFKDEHIRQTLIDQGRIRYTIKTIGTRYGRLKKAIDDNANKVLDEEMTDWHEGDDDIVKQAWSESQRDFEKARRDLEDRTWQDTAHRAARMMGFARFSKRAIKERLEALQRGDADPELELDPDLEARLERRHQKLKDRNRRQAVNARVAAKIQADAAATATERAFERVEQQEHARSLTDQEGFAEYAKRFGEADLEFEPEQHVQEQAQAFAEAMPSPVQSANFADFSQQEPLMNTDADLLDGRTEEEHSRYLSLAKDIVSRHLREGVHALKCGMNLSQASSPHALLGNKAAEYMPDPASASRDGPASARGVSDPRAKLAIEQLRDVCRRRGIGDKGSSQDMLERLLQLDRSMSLAALVDELERRGKSKQGSRLDLERRLAADDTDKVAVRLRRSIPIKVAGDHK